MLIWRFTEKSNPRGGWRKINISGEGVCLKRGVRQFADLRGGGLVKKGGRKFLSGKGDTAMHSFSS